jgi:hopanoid biosynthesis associated protein HpnK
MLRSMAARLRKLILTGDDFGRSHAINEAIERHHQAGVLTQASLMVNEPAAEEAVRIARRNPALCVGLHLTLCDGRASQPSALTGGGNELTGSPAKAGLRFAFSPRLEAPLRAEITAQFERFIRSGLRPVYWDGHTHLHLHPTVAKLCAPIAAVHGFRFTRLVRTRASFAFLPLIFRALSAAAIPRLKAHGIQFADHVFGLRETGRMSTATMQRLVGELPVGVNEIYFHPGAEGEFLDAPRVLKPIEARGIELTSSERLLAATE